MPEAKKEPSKRGRKKGVPNKITATIKQAMLDSFEKVGGVKWLANLAMNEPRSYAVLLAKIIPTQVEGADGGPVQIQVLTAVPDPEPDDDQEDG
jgi:hypothetical protein